MGSNTVRFSVPFRKTNMNIMTANDAWPLYRQYYTDLLKDDPSGRIEELPFRETWSDFKVFWDKVQQDQDLYRSWTHRLEIGYTEFKTEFAATLPH